MLFSALDGGHPELLMRVSVDRMPSSRWRHACAHTLRVGHSRTVNQIYRASGCSVTGNTIAACCPIGIQAAVSEEPA
jgi:hypothetical protein